MSQKERHEKCEEFRAQIKSRAQRAEEIKKLTVKTSYDETDMLRLTILLHKTDYAIGCEKEYKQLIVHLYQNEQMQKKAQEFYRRWTTK